MDAEELGESFIDLFAKLLVLRCSERVQLPQELRDISVRHFEPDQRC